MLDYYLFKQVYELFLKGKAEEAKTILTDLQEKYIEVSDENELLRTQIQEFEDILFLAKNLEYDGMSYWLKTAAIKQGPFCQRCFDKDGLLIRLSEHDDMWKCLTCGADFVRVKEKNGVIKIKEKIMRPGSKKVLRLYK
jgi:hypothetical protein